MEYRFKFDAYSPETIPMWRMAEYMADLPICWAKRARFTLYDWNQVARL